MAEFPALPLFTDAYMADTRHLTTLQHGAYLLMLMTAWRMPDCALPNDDIFLARICGVDRRTWCANKSVLLSFWTLDEQQRWVQGRLKDERNYVVQLANKNSLAGKASALKRLNRRSTTVPTKPQPKSNPHTHTYTQTEESKKVSKSVGARFALERPPEEWIEFCRKEKPQRDPLKIFDAFRDYWIAQPGQRGVKVDWAATWRNWIRKETSHETDNRNSASNSRSARPTWKSEGERLADKYRADAEREEQAAASGNPQSALCLTKTIRQDPE